MKVKINKIFLTFNALMIAALLLMCYFIAPNVKAESSNTPVTLIAQTLDSDGQKLVNWINDAVNLLSALTGVVITGSIIAAGIQYSTAGGNPQAAAAAKKRVSNAATALLAFVFMYAFLQWIVPGGIF